MSLCLQGLIGTVRALRQEERGVAMVEAFVGTAFLLFAALITLQIVLTFHARLAAHEAAIRVARTYALTRDMNKAQATYDLQTSTSIRTLRWDALACNASPAEATCTVRVHVPILVPGGGIFGDGGALSPLTVQISGRYPSGGG